MHDLSCGLFVGNIYACRYAPHHQVSIPRLLVRCQWAGDFCRDLSTREVVFASIAGLRGSISLIMAQAFVTESVTASADAQVSSCPIIAWVPICRIANGVFGGCSTAPFTWY